MVSSPNSEMAEPGHWMMYGDGFQGNLGIGSASSFLDLVEELKRLRSTGHLQHTQYTLARHNMA